MDAAMMHAHFRFYPHTLAGKIVKPDLICVLGTLLIACLTFSCSDPIDTLLKAGYTPVVVDGKPLSMNLRCRQAVQGEPLKLDVMLLDLSGTPFDPFISIETLWVISGRDLSESTRPEPVNVGFDGILTSHTTSFSCTSGMEVVVVLAVKGADNRITRMRTAPFRIQQGILIPLTRDAFEKGER